MGEFWGPRDEAKKEEAVGVVLEIKKPQEPVDFINFRFSSEMCHKNIQVFSDGKEVKKTVKGNWRCI